MAAIFFPNTLLPVYISYPDLCVLLLRMLFSSSMRSKKLEGSGYEIAAQPSGVPPLEVRTDVRMQVCHDVTKGECGQVRVS